MVASSEGGMNIEDVAKKNPDSIIKDPVDITTGSLSLSLSLVPLFLYFCNISYFFSPSLPHIFPSFFLSHFSLKLITLFLIPPGMSKEQAQAMARKIGFTTSCIDRVSLCIIITIIIIIIIIIVIDTVVYRRQSR